MSLGEVREHCVSFKEVFGRRQMNYTSTAQAWTGKWFVGHRKPAFFSHDNVCIVRGTGLALLAKLGTSQALGSKVEWTQKWRGVLSPASGM